MKPCALKPTACCASAGSNCEGGGGCQDLLLKSQIATLDLSLCERTREHPAPGRDYMEKIFAYRDWAKLALSLIKVTRD